MYTIGFVGIDNAGKTTIIDIFTKRRLSKTIPTVGVNLDEISFSEINFNVIDMGGQKNFRPLWIDYLNCVDVILYVIDASDHSRLEEAINEFRNMLLLTDSTDVPILILANKQDLPNTISAKELGTKLARLSELAPRDWNIIETSALTTQGLVEMFSWVYSKVTGESLSLRVAHKSSAERKYYSPCPLLLELSDGNYCLNHDNFTPVKVVPLEQMFGEDLNNPERVIRETIQEFSKMNKIVCFNSVFISENDDLIHCATDNTFIEVEGIKANAEEYEESYNMMHLTGGEICSECLYKILFSAIKRKLKSGKKMDSKELEQIKKDEEEKGELSILEH